MSIFVFGSNLEGRHGKGAAKEALQRHGAIYGQAIGRQGNSYAIPTKDARLRPLPLSCIAQHVVVFLNYATAHPDEDFYVTAVGCGLAGYTAEDIAPMFARAPNNCRLPDRWANYRILATK